MLNKLSGQKSFKRVQELQKCAVNNSAHLNNHYSLLGKVKQDTLELMNKGSSELDGDNAVAEYFKQNFTT